MAVSHDANFLEAVNKNERGLRIQFVWHRDRYAHTIAFVNDGKLRPLLASLEGGGEDNWPASPPLQNLSLEDRPDGRRVAMLVGMAGTSHWSVSIEPTRNFAGFLVDVACRVKDESPQLSSTYRTMATVTVSDDQQRAWIDDGIYLAIPPAVGKNCDVSRSDLWGEQMQLSVRPNLPSLERPATIRWQYQIGYAMPKNKQT